MAEISASFRTSGKSTSISHNNRDLEESKKMDKYHDHIQWEKTSQNITLEQQPIKQIYKDIFSDEVAKYNNKQKRKDRKIDDYYSKVKNDGSLDLQREFIVQFGDKDFLETHDTSQLFAEKLTEYHNWFKQTFPDLKIYNSVIHMDEATPHLHINVVPVADGYKQGMTKRPSFSKWLKNNNLEFKDFRALQTEKLTELIHSMGAERKKVGTHEYIKPSQYREMMAEATEKLNSTISVSNQMMSDAQKTRSEAFELKNDIEVLKRQKDSLERELEPFKSKRDELLTEINHLKQDLVYFSSEKEIASSELDIINAKKELVLDTKEKYLKTEPELTNLEVQDIINKASSGFGGLKGITLDVLKTIGKVISDLFATVTWFKRYTQQLELENKMLKEPNKQRFNKFEERVAKAKEVQANLNHVPKDISKDYKPKL